MADKGKQRPAAAEDALTLSGLIEAAGKRNLKLKAALIEEQRAQKRQKVESALDDPMLSFEYRPRRDEDEFMISLTQDVPFPGKLGTKRKIAGQDALVASLQAEAAKRDALADIKKAFYDYYFFDRALKVTRENEAVLEYLGAVTKSNYGLNTAGLDDLVRASRLYSDASTDAAMYESMREGAIARIRKLLNMNETEPLAEPEEIGFALFERTREEVLSDARSGSLDIKRASVEKTKGEYEVSLAKYSYLPDFVFGATYSMMRPDNPAMKDENNFGYMVGLRIPLWLGKKGAALKDARLGVDKALIMERDALSGSVNEALTLYAEITSRARVVALYDSRLIPEAERAHKLAEARYKNGKEKLSMLLEAEGLLLEFRLAYYRALTDYLKAVAELERITGKDYLPRTASNGNGGSNGKK
ncbi:MAG: TolC family protein [Deltaproteobacteria bacterium]|nr:TolC family protein [Deltaproteobacteria bacterium]